MATPKPAVSVDGSHSVVSRGGPRSGASVASRGQLGELQARLLAAKEARKLVDQDAQLLANRIALLKTEEEKAWRKIHQTRERARAIVRTRKENEAESGEIKGIAERNAKEKAIARAAREKQLAAQEKQRRAAAREMKQKKVEARKEMERAKAEAERKAKEKRERIATQREAARKKREAHEAKIAKRNKNLYDQKVRQEESERKHVETEVERLEIMELKLIEKLKKTQQAQQKAYIKLEDALVGE